MKSYSFLAKDQKFFKLSSLCQPQFKETNKKKIESPQNFKSPAKMHLKVSIFFKFDLSLSPLFLFLFITKKKKSINNFLLKWNFYLNISIAASYYTYLFKFFEEVFLFLNFKSIWMEMYCKMEDKVVEAHYTTTYFFT